MMKSTRKGKSTVDICGRATGKERFSTSSVLVAR